MNSLLNFDNVELSGHLSTVQTVYTSVTSAGYTPSRFYADRFRKGLGARTMDALYDALRMYKSGDAFVASTNKGYAAEMPLSNNNRLCCVILNRKDGTKYVKAVSVDENDISTAMTFSRDVKILILLGLIPEILNEPEAKEIYDSMSDFLEWEPDAEDWLYNNHVADFSQLLNRFSSNVEARLTFATENRIEIDVSNLSMLKKDEMNIAVVETFCGSPVRFTVQEKKTAKKEKKTDGSKFEGSYAYDPKRNFTETERNLVAKLIPNYVMPDFVPEICEYFKESSVFQAPMRVAYLIGPAGTGKTEAANAIFAGLGLPGGHYTCNPATEIFDFIGQVFPNCATDEDVSFESIRKQLGLPSTEDVVNDPESAYEAIYGEKCDTFPNEGTMIVDMMDRVMKYMASTGGNGKNFTYVESGLIRAARLGYGFEIQEIGCVLRPGVAVGLNALLETGGNAFITLPTGETIKKHPDCTFVFTSNDEYEGCCNLNQSVLDRMNLVYRIENPEKETMKERIMTRLHFPDEKILERMIDVIMDLSKASKERGIEDGVCGYRSLENWAMAVMIKSKKDGIITDALVYQTAIQTVMNKVSQKKDFVEELMSSLSYQFAAPNNV